LMGWVIYGVARSAPVFAAIATDYERFVSFASPSADIIASCACARRRNKPRARRAEKNFAAPSPRRATLCRAGDQRGGGSAATISARRDLYQGGHLIALPRVLFWLLYGGGPAVRPAF